MGLSTSLTCTWAGHNASGLSYVDDDDMRSMRPDIFELFVLLDDDEPCVRAYWTDYIARNSNFRTPFNDRLVKRAGHAS